MCCFSFQSKKSAAIESKHVEICIADFENLSTTKTIIKSKYIHEVSLFDVILNIHDQIPYGWKFWSTVLRYIYPTVLHLPHFHY